MAPEIFYTFLLAMTPLGELRVAIPVGVAVYKLSDFWVYVVSVAGNLVPVILILLFLGLVSKWFSERIIFCHNFFQNLFEKTHLKHTAKVEKYGFWALAIFTAIPLPITGGWTAALIAFLFDMPFKKALGAISLGVAVAGIIVLCATKAGILITQFYGIQALVGVLLTIAVFYLMFKIIKSKKRVIF